MLFHRYQNLFIISHRYQQFKVLGVDGIPTPKVTCVDNDSFRKLDNCTSLVLRPARRYTFAVTMPLQGGLVFEMPPINQTIAGIPSYSTPGKSITIHTQHLTI